MPESIPIHGPEPVVLTFIYQVSDDWIEEQILETGEQPANAWELTIDLRDVETPESRQVIRDGYRAGAALGSLPVLRAPTDDPLLVANAFLIAEMLSPEGGDPGPDASYVEDRRAWIGEHGSKRLQLAYARGYVINRLYVAERAAKDLPGFWIDTAGGAAWKPRANPSEEALDLETRIDGHLERLYGDETRSLIVWLTELPRDLQQHIDDEGLDADEQMEALLISRWLGRQNVFLPVDPQLRAPHPQEDEA